MTGLRDLKHCGADRAPMPSSVRATCAALIALAVLGTAYGLVADEPGRKVVERTVTMTESEFLAVTEAHFRDGMKAGIARKECNWDDVFKYPPKGRKGA